jgi:hypothetical protein
MSGGKKRRKKPIETKKGKRRATEGEAYTAKGVR